MLTRDFSLKVKALEDSGAFTGYASTYGPPADLEGDIVERGAFAAPIAQQGKGFPLLWAHDQSLPIGVGRLEDSRDGLIVNGQLVLEDPAAVKAHAHMKMGSVKGLSIGYRVPKDPGKTVYQKDGTRLLREIHLFEVSLVAVPCNQRAQVTSVKTLDECRYALKSLRNDQVTDDTLEHLLDIDAELKRLLVGHDPAAEREETLRELEQFAGELRQQLAA